MTRARAAAAQAAMWVAVVAGYAVMTAFVLAVLPWEAWQARRDRR